MSWFCFLICLFVCFQISANVWRWIRKDLRHFLDGTVVKTPCFKAGRGFDPWLGKFSTYQAMQPRGKKKRFQWTQSCFQSYALLQIKNCSFPLFFSCISCELSSKNPVAAFIIMLSVRLAHSTPLFYNSAFHIREEIFSKAEIKKISMFRASGV